jgi:hypothetical protein
MLGMNELKESIEITEKTVECPVKSCNEKVKRQRKSFQKKDKFKCQKHNIYISPSTFEYQCELNNLLWKDEADLELLGRIKKVKRESRITRDNSEDALTWNVFRFMENNNLLNIILGPVIDVDLKLSEIIYWSYSQKENNVWSKLNFARKEFGESINNSSEPDIIIKNNKALIFIEAKLSSGNNTSPSNKNNSKNYETGGNNWFLKVFKSDYKSVAIDNKKYELMRFWLLGTWLAESLGLEFYLVNLVLSEREKNIGSVFNNFIAGNEKRKFIRITWENIYNKIRDMDIINLSGVEKDIIINYFDNKSIGYNKVGKLQKAFSV